MFWCQIIVSSGRFPMHCKMYISTPGPCPPTPAVAPLPHHDNRKCLQTAASWEGTMDPGSDTAPSQVPSIQSNCPGCVDISKLAPTARDGGPGWSQETGPHTLHFRRSWGSVDVNFSGTSFETCTPLPCSLCLFLIYKILPLQLLPCSFFGSGLSRLPCFCPSRWRQRTASNKFPHNDAFNILKTVIQLLSSLPFSAVNNCFFQTCFFL